MDSVTSSTSECYCSEVQTFDSYATCTYCAFGTNDVWKSLTTDEKVKCIAYKKIVINGKSPSRLMIEVINKIHERHPDFDMSIVP